MPALVVAAQIHSAMGEHGAAAFMIEEWEGATAHSDPWRARYLPPAVRVLFRGDAAGAKDLASGLAVTATRDRLSVLTGKALFAEVKGNSEKARDLYQEAAQGWADYGFVLEEGQANLGLARCLLALGDCNAASEPLHKARAIFSRLGAVQQISETDTYLDQAEAASYLLWLPKRPIRPVLYQTSVGWVPCRTPFLY